MLFAQPPVLSPAQLRSRRRERFQENPVELPGGGRGYNRTESIPRGCCNDAGLEGVEPQLQIVVRLDGVCPACDAVPVEIHASRLRGDEQARPGAGIVDAAQDEIDAIAPERVQRRSCAFGLDDLSAAARNFWHQVIDGRARAG